MTPRQAEALRLYRETGSKTETARRLGVDISNLSKMLLKAEASERAEAEEPDRVKEALIGAEGADAVWLKSKGASILWRRPKAAQDPMGILDALKAGLGELPRAAPMEQPDGPSAFLTVFPVTDLHVGMLADAEEGGADWDAKISGRVFADAFDRLVSVSPDAGTAILAQLGDLLHIDDQRNVTPASHHQLDADGRYFKVLRRGVATMKAAIDALRARYPKVIYRGSRGNHDEHAHHAVTLALAEHYRDTPGVQIVQNAGEVYVHQFGLNMIVTHHGDRLRPEQLAHYVAADHAAIWGRTRFRTAYSGHIHQFQVKQVGGLRCESVGTIIPRDGYAASRFPQGDRALISVTHHRDLGKVASARVGIA